ncbi:hypothetical protein Efla_007346 [Eimeria flavescens]
MAFVVLVCRVVTCVDTSADDGLEDAPAAAGIDFSDSISPLGSRQNGPSAAEFYPGPNDKFSAAAARRQWNAIQNYGISRADAAVPSSRSSDGLRGRHRRLAIAEDIANGILYAARDPLTRWVHPNRELEEEAAAAADTNHASSSLPADTTESNAPQSPYRGVPYRRPRRHFLCDVALQSAVCGAMTFMFSFIFGLFTIVMFCDQLSSILSNTTGIESLQKVKNEKKSACILLKEVFGGPFGFYWFLPVPVTASQVKRFLVELNRFPGCPSGNLAAEAGNGASVASVRSSYESGASHLPAATRRGRSPLSAEDGTVDVLPLSQAAADENADRQQVGLLLTDFCVVLFQFDWESHALPPAAHGEEQQISLDSGMFWTVGGREFEAADAGVSADVFSSPILRQPQTPTPPPFQNALGQNAAQTGWTDSSRSPPPASAAAAGAAPGDEAAAENAAAEGGEEGEDAAASPPRCEGVHLGPSYA